MKTLQGKIVLLTGASGGIGTALVRQLAEAGASLLLCGRSEEKLAAARSLAEAQGAPVQIWTGDLTASDAPASCVAAAKEAFGGLDILINNAGMALSCPLEDTTPDQFDRIMALNVRAPYFLCQAALPALRQSNHAVIDRKSVV